MNRTVRQSVVENRQVRPVDTAGTPQPLVRVVDAVALIVGIVIGAGIFRTPSIVAGNAASTSVVYAAWILGGLMSLVGATVYAELATTYPHAGGDYYFLTRAFGRRLAFLFGWARMSVIQTGSITLFAFVVGDYASQIVSLGEYSPAIYATLVVLVLTGLNILGVRLGTTTQNLLTAIQVLGMVLVILAGFMTSSPDVAPDTTRPGSTSSFGLMMVFVLFTYGGWNEAAYVSGELKDVRRNMARALILGVLVITALYVAINWAYLHGLGLSGVAGSQQVAADLVRKAFGDFGAKGVSLLIVIAALTSANATIFTGGRSSYAFGRDFRQFGIMGRWNSHSGTPVNGLLIQGGVSLVLVLLGVFTRQGFQTMVDYTAPVFWFFFLLTGLAFFVLRHNDPTASRPFRVPLYPIPPLVFCIMCAYLLYSSLAYVRIGALAGVAVLAIGALMLLFVHPSTSDTKENEGRS
jgi:basic amino acid/polyamine antiporter, APA family